MKIYDCFTFFNELDLLEIRLNELNQEVDFFVLVEATFTHQGNPKPLYFEQHKLRYAAFLQKIIHVVVTDIPEKFYTETSKTWILENHQRNCIARGIQVAAENDLILISDIDEIPKSDSIKQAKLMSVPVVFAQVHHAYFFNTIFIKPKNFNYYKKKFLSLFFKKYKIKFLRDNFWLGTIMISKKMIETTIQYWRNQREAINNKHTILENAGWHFTYLGGVTKIIEKLNALNEEFDYKPYMDSDYLKNALNNKKPILPNQEKFEAIKNNYTLPKYISDNHAKFSTYFYQ